MAIKLTDLRKVFGNEKGVAVFAILAIPDKKLLSHAEDMGCGNLLDMFDDPDDQRLEMINFAMGGHGVEALFDGAATVPILTYVNLGDTYSTTICCYRNGYNSDYLLTSWGDWYELYEMGVDDWG